MMNYDRRSVERRRLVPPHPSSAFQYWIVTLILIAFLLSLLK